MMRRPAVVALCGAALLATPTAVAHAQDEGPVLTVTPAVACGTVTLTATSTGGSYEIAAFSGPNAGDADARAEGQFRVGSDTPISRTVRLPEDDYAGSAFVSWATISGPERDAYVSGAVGVDTGCSDPVVAPPVTPTPTPAELCDAADIDAAAALIAGAATSADLGILDGLLALDTAGELIVGFGSGVELGAVRDALDCDPDDTTTPATPGATPTLPDGTDGTDGTDEGDEDFDQIGGLGRLPSGGVATGA